jgi:hypothetical protein
LAGVLIDHFVIEVSTGKPLFEHPGIECDQSGLFFL